MPRVSTPTLADIRPAYLAAAHAVRPVIANATVAERWNDASTLQKWTIGGLAAHTARAVLIVEDYLKRPVDDNEVPDSAAEYFVAVMRNSTDIDDEVNTGIRSRADETAALGHARVLADFDHALDRIRGTLAAEPSDRLITVFGDRVMTLDDYLQTRIVELAVHTDDLCVSLGIPTPQLPGADVAIATLVDVARHRHGDVGVLRALARRERDADEALRVF